jgi:hypothetical protein
MKTAGWMLVVAAALIVGYIGDVRLVRGNDAPELGITDAVEVTLYSPDLAAFDCSLPHVRVWAVDDHHDGGQQAELLWAERLLIVANTPDDDVYVAAWCDGQDAPAWELPKTPGSNVILRFSSFKAAGSIESFAYLADPS